MPTATPLFGFVEMKQPAVHTQPTIHLSVSDLTHRIKMHIETQFESIWVVGQVSNLTYHRSGHIYFTLKDEDAQLPCAVWKTSASKIKFKLKDGMAIVCRGRLTVFPPQGKYQLVVSEIQPKGIGTLELAFQQLRDKLAAEGLFQSARKLPMPYPIKQVAVITSPTGAAIKDFLQILRRRTKLIDVLIVPAKVQGDGAAEEIAQAIGTVNRLDRIDCIVLTRGGGSIEDLWAFNEEVLVRAVAASVIPVVSAVGHEVDVTLCDFVADIRAATPSEAAERISREDSDRRKELVQTHRRLNDRIDQRLRMSAERLRLLIQHPVFRQPEQFVEACQYRLDLCEEQLDQLMNHCLRTSVDRLGKAAASLEVLSPLSILSRGYTLTEKTTGERIRSADEVRIGEVLRTRFADGIIESQCTLKRGARYEE